MHVAMFGWLSSVACVAMAQEAATIGRVVDSRGDGLAGFEVHFASSLCAGAAVGAPRLVRAITDANGRFRVSLATGRGHSAWAIGPAGLNRLRSEVHENVLAGAVVDFKAVFAAPAPSCRVDDFASLGGGPFALEVRLHAMSGPTWRVDVATDGSFALPALPYGDVSARLLDVDGRPYAMPNVGFPYFVPHFVPLPPVTRRFVVRDADGKPVAGAIVHAIDLTTVSSDRPTPFSTPQQAASWFRSPPTDADGATTLVVRGVVDLCFASDERRASRVANWRGPTPIVDGVLQAQALDDDPTRAIVMTLRDSAPLVVRTRPTGPEDAGAALIAVTSKVVCVGEGLWSGSSMSFQVVHETRFVDGEATIGIDRLPRPLGSLAITIGDRGGVPIAVLPRHELPTAPIELAVESWPKMTLQTLTADGGPPVAARVLLWSATTNQPPMDPYTLSADRAGRATVAMEPGEWFVVATDGRELAHTTVVVAPGGDAHKVELRLQPLARLAGRVLDIDDQPVVGLTFWAGGSMSAPLAANATLLERLVRHHEPAINNGLLHGVRTDADGRFDLCFLQVEGVQRIVQPSMWSGAPIVLQPQDDLQLRIER